MREANELGGSVNSKDGVDTVERQKAVDEAL